ncbi:hypothetical protein BLNAU_12807 [Blattamonas nauphoetae]|uniref:Uncharacterized protein n=1 Tax=Blattamonas nauphoetae TaxID=2049346 RepID=A0ABQ9XLP5_9EUKA|nr:hypothetical protein BLNAU_12807 [Blattamonas nauphoetae]
MPVRCFLKHSDHHTLREQTEERRNDCGSVRQEGCSCHIDHKDTIQRKHQHTLRDLLHKRGKQSGLSHLRTVVHCKGSRRRKEGVDASVRWRLVQTQTHSQNHSC